MFERAAGRFAEQVNSEAGSIGRLATGQSGDANIPITINGKPGPGGIARTIMAAYQTVRDYENAANYLSRPYKITNAVATIVIPEAGAISGVYNFSQGNYQEAIIDVSGAALGLTFRAFNTSEQFYVTTASKVVNNIDETATLLNQGVRDFKEMESVVVKTVPKVKSGTASEFRPLETLRGNGDSKQVANIMKAMKSGEKMPPIQVYVNNGKKYVLDGHHRLEAASRLNATIEYTELSLEEAMKRFRYKDAQEIIRAHFDNFMQSRLNNRLIKKVLDE
jgi:alkylated DNA nucleotide flippase Atl1